MPTETNLEKKKKKNEEIFLCSFFFVLKFSNINRDLKCPSFLWFWMDGIYIYIWMPVSFCALVLSSS